MATIDLLDRLSGTPGDENDPEDNKIPTHQFYAALVALADGKLTRGQIETYFNIPTTGSQSTQLTTIINNYTGISGGGATDRQIKYLDRLHIIFMLIETQQGQNLFTKTEINTWLTEIANGTI